MLDVNWTLPVHEATRNQGTLQENLVHGKIRTLTRQGNQHTSQPTYSLGQFLIVLNEDNLKRVDKYTSQNF